MKLFVEVMLNFYSIEIKLIIQLNLLNAFGKEMKILLLESSNVPKALLEPY